MLNQGITLILKAMIKESAPPSAWEKTKAVMVQALIQIHLPFLAHSRLRLVKILEMERWKRELTEMGMMKTPITIENLRNKII